MVWLASSAGEPRYCNRRLLEYVGESAAALGVGWMQMVHLDELAVTQAAWARSLATGEPFEAECRLRDREGRYRWFLAQAQPQRDEAGRLVRWVGTCTEVIEWRAAEERIQASERRYRALFESNPHPMWVYDTQTLAFLAVNDAAVERYGYARDEFLAMTVDEIRPPEDVPALLEDIRLTATELRPRGSWRHRWKDGTVRDVEVSAHSVPFAGRPARLVLALDVTDRVQAEAASAQAVARSRAVIESMADGVVVSGPQVNLIEWNTAALRMHGYATAEEARCSLAEFARRFTLTYLDGTPLSLADWPMVRILRGEVVADEEFILTRPDARLELVVRCSGSPVLGPAGSVELGVLTVHDVTRWKRAESEVRRTAALLHAVADGTTDAVFVKDRVGKYLLFNEAAARFVGKAVSEVIGQDDTALFDADGARQVMARDRHVMESGRAETAEEVLAAAGTVRIYQATKAPYRDAKGNVVGLIGVSRDVTDQKRVEEELRKAQQRLQYVLSSSPAVLYSLTVEDMRIRGVGWISDNLQEMLGYSPAQATCADWWVENVHPDDRELVIAGVSASLLADGRAANEYRFRRSDGQYRWLRSEMRLFRDAESGVVEAIGSWSDVTERKQIEIELMQAQKMEAVGRLAGGIAHDFNNLLTIINGYADFLLDSLPEDGPDHSWAAEIRDAGERAARLTAQLLAFSRKTIVEPRVLDLNAVLSQSVSMLRRLIGEDVTVMTDLVPGLSSVKADLGQVEQVVFNLAVNARDAMPKGGRLTIRTRNHLVSDADAAASSGLAPGRYVQLAVADTGCGMSEEVKKRVFEPFFTTKAPGKGPGLGLATVYGIVKACGGHIRVESKLGTGTTFLILLPAIMGEVNDPLSRQGKTPRMRNETLLLIEDEASVRGVAKRALDAQGYTVLEAGSGLEAIQVIERHPGPIDLLVTDVVMPGMGGRDVAKELRKRLPGLRVLYLSGYTDDTVVRHGIVEGTDPFLQKPFTPVALAQKVRAILDKDRPVQ
jgi:PAS domain S-box-containing protein